MRRKLIFFSLIIMLLLSDVSGDWSTSYSKNMKWRHQFNGDVYSASFYQSSRSYDLSQPGTPIVYDEIRIKISLNALDDWQTARIYIDLREAIGSSEYENSWWRLDSSYYTGPLSWYSYVYNDDGYAIGGQFQFDTYYDPSATLFEIELIFKTRVFDGDVVNDWFYSRTFVTVRGNNDIFMGFPCSSCEDISQIVHWEQIWAE